MNRKSAMLAVMIVTASVVLYAVADAVEQTGKNITVTGDATIAVTNAEFEIDVASGGRASINPAYPVTVRAQAGGSVTLHGDAWQDKVGLWLDASEEWTLEAERTESGAVKTVTESGVKSAAIVRWRDRRPEQTEWIGYNNRGTGMADGTYTSVMPYVVSNGCNGLTYLTCGNLAAFGRRLPFIKVVDGVEQATVNGNGIGNGLENDAYSLDVKYVVMAFGSQRGGGNAVAGHLTRAATGASTTADVGLFGTARATRLNGNEVNPETTGLNGGWQIVSFAPNSGEKVSGLGFGPSAGTYGSYYGGQNYAEVLLFTNMPTAYEIASVERYLAKKWGISTYSTADGVSETRLYGSGTVSVESGEVHLGGEFSGMVAVAADATLVLTDSSLAPTNPVSGMHGWYDPDRTDTVKTIPATVNGATVDRVDVMTNLADAYNGKANNLAGFGRSPRIMSDTRGWGIARHWCDYHTTYTGGNGNTMRFNDATDGTANCLPTRTGFMVLDTTEGVGTPFLDTSIYSFNGSVNSLYVMARVPSSPIFRTQTGTAAFSPAEDAYVVTNSPAWLDGQSVQSGKRGYNARAELLSFTFSKEIPIRCFGSWQQEAAYSSAIGLRHGEIILYPTSLSDADRKATEAYLMKKWLGKTPAGYGDPSGMTVTGAGTVFTANGALRPKTDAGFTGVLSIGGASLDFTFDPAAANPVANAISVANGELSTAGALTVNVAFASKPAAGTYVLVSAAKWNVAAVSLGEVTGSIGPAKASRLALERTGNVLTLTVSDVGACFIVR